ncbi:MAG: HNH endonuclease domain-containing protein, partial [Bacteroidota bacterium]|nr:HNH endonuclease domain-containing protein [Bacteroidota bacterium]
MKTILGLDLGTNSIGWALIQQDFDAKKGEILGMGSRIIPMTQDVLDIFSGGKPLETQTAVRTNYRSVRRLRERHLLRRERLHRVLSVLGFLPEHYAKDINFNKHYGQFIAESEPKLTYHNRNFIFKSSFEEMLNDFKQSQPQLFYRKANGEETKIPYDWTIYYLRKKALSRKIAKEELAWIILNFNQKRGYYQLRGEEEEENPNKLVEFHSLKVVDVIADEKPNSKGDLWYSLHLENGWVYRRSSKTPLFDWKDKVRDFIVTTDFNDDGTIKTDKEGNERRSFRAPSEDDWTLLKKKTEQEINKSDETVGVYIYENLLRNPSQKIRGKLVRTIERKFYKEELVAILKKQIALQPELFTNDLYNDCVRELYRNNEVQQLILSKRDFVHLFVEDILFYQRPLRSQKSSIGNCSLEYRIHKDKDGNKVKEYLKAIPKSHPLYQEFRVWQWLSNLKIYRKEDDTDITTEFLKHTEDVVNLFEWLMTQKEIGHKDILKYLVSPALKERFPNAKPAAFNKEVDKEIAKYRWNYVFDDSKEKEEDKSKKYPCNSTGYEIRRRLDKVVNIPAEFLTSKTEQHLWHVIYSVTDKKEYETALRSFANKYKLDENSFVEEFRKFPPFPSEYGAYSEKAIKKLLPLMRLGKYWSWNAIDTKTQNRIDKIILGEYDENIKTRVREKTINLTDNNHFQGLPIWLASYVIYDRYSEADIAGKWDSVAGLEQYLEEFKQHSLRNPIVEQVITETLRVVRDIWKQFGQGAKDFFNEIHVELGREMKNTADDRKYLTEQVTNNEATNQRIKVLLAELKENSDGKLLVENVRPFSPMQQDALRIYEDGVLNSTVELPEDIVKISKSSQPSKSELQRYKLWLEQKYRSPYTGQMIPLGRLFTEDYQIEHIIPKSRYFDDSFNNKVICESAVNQLKDKLLGLEFIKKYPGQKVECGMGKVVEIFTEEAYQSFVKEHYAKSKIKRQNLLLEDIPEKMIARQMNDTRYISKFISSLLSNIVRADKEDDGVNSKNLIPGNGRITTVLKKDWGMDAVWSDLILPRFERMNQLTNSDAFTYWNEQYQKFLPVDYSPADSKRIEKKRIDHRHHAMDALVIACMTREHVNLLNNQSAKSEISRYDLQNKLRNKTKETWIDKKTKEQVERDVFKEFKQPWDNFTVDARNILETIVVSFKQNLRVINKATNNYEKWIEKGGKKIKAKVKQEGTNWAIRKSLHEETISGKVDLPWVSVSKGNFLTATRKNLDASFTLEKIRKITDTGIQKILEEHLKRSQNNPDLAFSPEGIEDMNRKLLELNGGKKHNPIYKVRLYEMGSSRFALGMTYNKQNKFVQGAPNLYFAIYSDSNNKRAYETIPLNIVIERLKQGLQAVPEKNAGGNSLLNVLSPLDLVYIPTEEEIEMPHLVKFGKLSKYQMERIFNVNDFSGVTAYFSQNSFAKNIFPKEMDLSWNEKKQ